jgi:hypothetical protein
MFIKKLGKTAKLTAKADLGDEKQKNKAKTLKVTTMKEEQGETTTTQHYEKTTLLMNVAAI